MRQATVLAFSIVLAGLAAGGAGAASIDPLTRLPIYPGMEYVSASSEGVCGTMIREATYSPRQGNLTTVDQWFAAHLAGFKRIHGTNRNYPYDVFINSDGTLSVSILGSGPNRGVEGVVYHRNAKPASLGNLTNWLDGSDPLCH
jgi:hypothetical protein